MIMFLKRIKNKNACTLFVIGYNKIVLEIRINKNTDAREAAEQDASPKRERKEVRKSYPAQQACRANLS